MKIEAVTIDAYGTLVTLRDPVPALQAALSAYNTGNFSRGFENGYVARYFGRATIPSIAGIATPAAATPVVWHASPPPAAALNPYTADINVYQREATNVPIR